MYTIKILIDQRNMSQCLKQVLFSCLAGRIKLCVSELHLLFSYFHTFCKATTRFVCILPRVSFSLSYKSLKIIFYQYAESGGTAHCEFRTRRALLPQSRRPNKVTHSTCTPVNNAADPKEQLRTPLSGERAVCVRKLPPVRIPSRVLEAPVFEIRQVQERVDLIP